MTHVARDFGVERLQVGKSLRSIVLFNEACGGRREWFDEPLRVSFDELACMIKVRGEEHTPPLANQRKYRK